MEQVYEFSGLRPIDREPVYCRSITLSDQRYAFLSAVIKAIQVEDPPGGVNVALEISNDGSNWSAFDSIDVTDTQIAGGGRLPNPIGTHMCRVVTTVGGLSALVDVTLRLGSGDPTE